MATVGTSLPLAISNVLDRIGNDEYEFSSPFLPTVTSSDYLFPGLSPKDSQLLQNSIAHLISRFHERRSSEDGIVLENLESHKDYIGPVCRTCGNIFSNGPVTPEDDPPTVMVEGNGRPGFGFNYVSKRLRWILGYTWNLFSDPTNAKVNGHEPLPSLTHSIPPRNPTSDSIVISHFHDSF